jgi:hypothetical protein
MSQVGSTKDIVSQSITGVTDDLGNSVVSTSTGFASSPLGVSARAQALYGIANPNFNLTPPDVDAEIEDQSNPLPFWTIDNASDGEMSATTIFDETSQTYGVELNPGTAAIDSTLTLTTRSYILTDDNLALRQRALSVLSKSGTAAGTTEWNLTLTAIYYDATDTALSTAVIGTALDTGTWTSISGTTTPGGSAINSAAQYVDLSFKMTATAAVTGSAKATIRSLILATSTPAGGGGNFVVTEALTTSQTWNVPTGVDTLLAVVGVGGGGGGGGGGGVLLRAATTPNTGRADSGGGGGGARWAILRDLYIGTATSISVGVGAGGSGGTAGAERTKAGGVTTISFVSGGGGGGNGGSTTFGTYLTVPGGLGGNGGSGIGQTTAAGGTAGTGIAGTAATSGVYGLEQLTASNAAGTSQIGLYTQLPFTPDTVLGANGAEGSTSGGSGTAGTGGPSNTGTAARYGGGGGGATNFTIGATSTFNFGTPSAATFSGGGSGATVGRVIAGTATIIATAGAGGSAGANSGSGGGGGGAAILASFTTAAGTASYNASTLTATPAAGGAGADGVVYVVYVA